MHDGGADVAAARESGRTSTSWQDAKNPLSEGVPPKLQVIDDTVYPQDFWMDAEDEGLGGGR